MKKIIGPGSLIVDITAYSEHAPVDGETVVGRNLRIGPGGKGSNQMTAAHRAGAQAVIIGKIGDDWLSQVMLGHYAKEGMSTKYIGTVPGGETGSALINVSTTTSQNRIIIIKGASDAITKADVEAAEDDFATSDLVMAQLETSIESVEASKVLARKFNKPFLLNPAPFQKIPDDLFAGVDYLTPNETEAEFFSGIPVNDEASALAAAKHLLAMGSRNVVITLGKSGAFFANGQESFLIPGIEVQAVDSTGAGDAFNGGLAVALAEGADIATALRFANCTGALSVTKLGTSPAMPYRQEIVTAMKHNYGIDYPA